MKMISDFDLFDRFIKNQLSPEERSGLNRRFASDPEFKKSFDEYSGIIDLLKKSDLRANLSGQLETLHAEMMQKKPVHKNRRIATALKLHSPTMAVAASVTIIVLAAFILTLNYINSLRTQEDEFIRLRREMAQIRMSQREVVATLRDSKKENPAGSYTGTGFLVNKEGYVLTCYHLVKNEDSLFLRNTRFGNVKAYLIKYDLVSDLALLHIRDSAFLAPRQVPVFINETESMIGEKVFTLGYPKYDVVYSEGVVSSITGYQVDTTSYQISLPLNPGNSGGPLINEAGYIIGIVNGKNITQEGSAFALKSTYLRNFLEEPIDSLTRINILSIRKPAFQVQNRPLMIKSLSDYIFEVKVFE
jgi:S1-C subfamily serine protease